MMQPAVSTRKTEGGFTLVEVMVAIMVLTVATDSLSATGTAEAYMKGWRRPHLDRQLSDKYPTSGSLTASKTSAMRMARPINLGSTPITVP